MPETLPYISAKIFCDTSFFYASISKRDINHQKAIQRLHYSVRHKITFFTTWDIISETLTLLRYRSSFEDAIEFMDNIVPHLAIVSYDESVRNEAKEIFRRFGKDKNLSFCDAISFVVVSNLMNHIPCFSFDEDFKRLGLTIL